MKRRKRRRVCETEEEDGGAADEGGMGDRVKRERDSLREDEDICWNRK